MFASELNVENPYIPLLAGNEDEELFTPDKSCLQSDLCQHTGPSTRTNAFFESNVSEGGEEKVNRKLTTYEKLRMKLNSIFGFVKNKLQQLYGFVAHKFGHSSEESYV